MCPQLLLRGNVPLIIVMEQILVSKASQRSQQKSESMYPTIDNDFESETVLTIQKDEKLFSLTLLTPERGEIALPTKPLVKQKSNHDKGIIETFKKKDSKAA